MFTQVNVRGVNRLGESLYERGIDAMTLVCDKTRLASAT